MSNWDNYPATYRQQEVRAISAAVQAGECVSLVGLSGAGKSNLLGFIAARIVLPEPGPRFRLVDCNRLAGTDSQSFYRLVSSSLAERESSVEEAASQPVDELKHLETGIDRALKGGALSLLFDRFDRVAPALEPSSGYRQDSNLPSNLRALRDAYKYSLTYVTSTRRPLDPSSELAELFYGNIIWLGPLSEPDAFWSTARYAERKGLAWTKVEQRTLVDLAWGYPSFLRAACEAYAAGVELNAETLRAHPAVQRRVAEFWSDRPSSSDLEKSGLYGHPFLAGGAGALTEGKKHPGVENNSLLKSNSALLTAKEHLLLAYFQAHPNQVCEKDDLIIAVWPEDRVLMIGLRDDSLAQLVRRLRKKIEPDPSNPRYLHTVPGRGYRYTPS